MAQSIKFWDKSAEKYSRQPIADQASYEKKLAVTREYFRPDMEVLEIGCGTGSTALLHAPYVNHIRAIDFSTNMLAIARRKAMDQGIENVTFEKATIDDLDVPSYSLDMVMGMSILHLLKDRGAVIAKVYKMLKPGGLFVSSTVCLGDSMPWFKLIAPIGKALGAFPLVKVIKADDLVASLTQAGFTIEHQWQPGETKASFTAVFIVAKKPG